jgi:hypothetical protein|tara:strand:- start:529 stop:714 length:186 start_codon:yes stop_codon:yes gene_type:complete
LVSYGIINIKSHDKKSILFGGMANEQQVTNKVWKLSYQLLDIDENNIKNSKETTTRKIIIL